jgi:hypothetical protein
LAAILRQAGMRVSIFSPLMSGVTGVVREPRAKPWGLIDQRLRYWSALSTNPLVKRVRAKLASRHGPALAQQTEQVAAEFERQLRRDPPQAVLVSTYLMYKPLCERIANLCRAMNIPVLIGGPYFAQKNVALVRADWTRRDPQITQALAALGRNGVPVYVLYRPGKAPVLLPEVLKASLVHEALATL